MAISGHISEEATNYFGHLSSEQLRACSNIPSDELTGRPYRSHPEQCFCGFIHSYSKSLEQFVFWLTREKTCVFLSALIRPDFIEHVTFRFCKRDLKTSGKSAKLDAPNYFNLLARADCELWWFVNLTVWHFWHLKSCTTNSNKDSDWLIATCFLK